MNNAFDDLHPALDRVLYKNKHYALNHHLSRALTNTTGEQEEGIFTSSISVYFYRGSKEVLVNLGKPWKSPKSWDELFFEINRRVELVEQAFIKLEEEQLSTRKLPQYKRYLTVGDKEYPLGEELSAVLTGYNSSALGIFSRQSVVKFEDNLQASVIRNIYFTEGWNPEWEDDDEVFLNKVRGRVKIVKEKLKV